MDERTRARAGEHRADAVGRARRTPSRSRNRTTLVVGAVGGGKTTYARRRADAAGGRVVRATAEWADAEFARRRLATAVRARPPVVVIDDAHHLVGTAAESALATLLAEPPVDHLIVVYRTMPTFEFRPDELVTVTDLALSLTDIVALFREHAGRRIDLETAAHVADETVGWPELVRRLAVARGPSDESFALALDGELTGDFASAWLEESLDPLPGTLREALARAAILPGVDLARASQLLGFPDAAALIAALDAGLVMHSRTRSGRRVLPPLLRRHLLDRMPQADRRRAGEDAARVLLELGDAPGAADALASGGAWSALADLLESTPEAGRGASHWIRSVPPRVIRSTAAYAAAAGRARREDVESVHLGSPPVVGSGDPLAVAARSLSRGDAASAVRWFRRSLLEPGSPRAELLARLSLAVIRAPLAGPRLTAEALTAVEADARSDALGGLARVVRGAIAATCRGPERMSVRRVTEHLQARGDVDGALLVDAMDLLARVRRGEPADGLAFDIVRRADSRGLAELSTWALAGAALARAATGEPDGAELAAAARARAITAGLAGPGALLEAAAALGSPAAIRDRRLAGARRLALETGLPRIPLPVGPASARPASGPLVAERSPRVEVACFGGFRLRLDGGDADLRGIRPQARAVLRMLALNAGAPLHRDLIASLLWGELAGESALHALHVSVSSLRRMLPGEPDGTGIVERVGEAYRIGIADRHDCDLASFDDLLTAAADAKHAGDATTARDGLVGALDLYVGEVLPEDGPAEWAVGARERYRLRAAEAANALAHLHARLGDPRAAVTAAHRAVEIDPWVDESWRTLITMHRRAGDVIAGRRAEAGYRSMRRTLGVD